MTFEGFIETTKSGGVLVVRAVTPADVRMETWYKRRTLTQLATLKAIESLLYWANYDMFPAKSTDLAEIHQVIMNHAGLYHDDAKFGRLMVTTSSNHCTTVHMNRFIEVAIQFLLEADVPHTMVEPAAQMNFQELYREWYKLRSLDEDMDDITWEEYKKRVPFDEFNCVQATEDCQKMHIISRGAQPDAIDESWNWIRGPESIHIRIQHQKGWGPVLQEFPHLIPKVERARKMAHKKGLI